ncbi:MAG TPA: hypothetical protein PLB46_11875 [Chitinophagales bacterium]|nr:hypothetical protein [Chitinophagales bacterium]
MALTETDKATIFNTLVEALQTCTPPMVVTKNTNAVFELIGNKPVPYGYKKEIIPGMYFSSVVARKDMVSFYVFPLYGQEDLFKDIAPIAMKCLKGKTCFNFKKTEQVNKKEIVAILKQGVKIWKQMGYLK